MASSPAHVARWRATRHAVRLILVKAARIVCRKLPALLMRIQTVNSEFPKVPLQITFKGTDQSDALEARVREKVERLARMAPDLQRCHVTIEGPPRHTHQGRLWRIVFELSLPGGPIVVGRAGAESPAHDDVYVALRDACEAAMRQLEDRTRKRRGEVKAHADERID
jgi:ribosome-associated translation inhibitor RaiA